MDEEFVKWNVSVRLLLNVLELIENYPSGNASLSSDESLLLVNTLASTGRVDVYRFPEDTSCLSLPFTESKRHSIRQCLFADGGKVTVCGAKNNKVHVFDIAAKACIHAILVVTKRYLYWLRSFMALMPFPETKMIQALAITRDGRCHLIASSTMNRSPTIYI